MVISASPLRRSSVNVGYLRHERANSGHLRFASQALMSGTCDTKGRRLIIAVLSFAHLRHSHTRLVGCETEIEVSFAIYETFSCSSQLPSRQSPGGEASRVQCVREAREGARPRHVARDFPCL